jgi:predicted acyltransferase
MALFALAFFSRKVQWIGCTAILVGYWALFAAWPLPGTDFDYAAVGVAKDSPQMLPGFQAHWNMNSNPAWAFDTWFLNLFPREEPFKFNGGGYSTISFIPTLATMILGLIAGGLMKDGPNAWKTGLKFLILGAALTAVGYGLGEAGICPVVKKIWTPSWVLFSGGLCFAALGVFVWICDAVGLTPLFWPIRIIGANCIFVYVVIHWWDRFIQSNIKTHLGQDIFKSFGAGYEPLVAGLATVLVYWLIVAWMDRNKIRIRI